MPVRLLQMSEFPVDGSENGDMHTVMENFQKKNNLVTGRTHHVTHHPQVTTTSSQVITSCFSFPALLVSQIFAHIFRDAVAIL